LPGWLPDALPTSSTKQRQKSSLGLNGECARVRGTPRAVRRDWTGLA